MEHICTLGDVEAGSHARDQQCMHSVLVHITCTLMNMHEGCFNGYLLSCIHLLSRYVIVRAIFMSQDNQLISTPTHSSIA